MASDFTKPDRVHTLYDNEIESKMYPLPIGDLFGIGKKTSEKLINIGINTIGDLAHTTIDNLTKYFKNQSINMINQAKGIDYSEVVNEKYNPDSISNEITLLKDIDNKQELYPFLLSLSEGLGIRIRKQKKYANVICVILKDNYFKRSSHQKKIKNATNITKEIYEVAKEILDEMEISSVRLIGIRLDKLTNNINYQISLFDNETKEEKEVIDFTLDNLKQKYGNKIITKASLANNKERKHLEKD